MPDGDIPAEPVPTPDAPQPTGGDAVTPGGYAYEVVAEDGTAAATGPRAPAPESGGRRVPVWALFGVMILAAVLAGLVVWVLLRGTYGGGDDESLTTTGSGLLNAFTAGGEAETTRFEGELPPDFPDDIPIYDGATLVASVVQVSDPNAGFIVVHDTDDDRDTVAASLSAALDEGSWQIDGAQESRDASLYQFSKVDDADITGIVLLTASTDGSRTTIITSIQDADGAADLADDPFVEPSRERNKPAGYPNEVPSYEGAILIEAAFQKEPGRTSFALSYITKDDADAVADFYREVLAAEGLTVEDGDPTTSPLEDAQVISFSNEDLTLTGEVAIGTFAEDEEYTRIDVQVGDERDDDASDDEPTPEDSEGS